MFKIIALICAASISHADCQYKNARSFATIGKVSNEIYCGVESQQDLGKLANFQGLADGEYIKIVCLKERKDNNE